jgi:hypothetical protein
MLMNITETMVKTRIIAESTAMKPSKGNASSATKPLEAGRRIAVPV